MLLAHRIRLDPTPAQQEYFARAAGTARRVWNWALAEWQRAIASHEAVNAFLLKKRFNAIKYSDPAWLDEKGQPWLRDIHRDAHSQPFTNLSNALARNSAARRNGQRVYPLRFKKKGRCRDRFYLANDKFRIEDKVAVLPKIGRISICESLRYAGKIMGATVSREADHWFIAIHVEMPDAKASRPRRGDGIVGVDLGITTAVTLSTGEKIAGPRPLKAALRRLRIRHRRHSRKLNMMRCGPEMHDVQRHDRHSGQSANAMKTKLALACLYSRTTRIRLD